MSRYARLERERRFLPTGPVIRTGQPMVRRIEDWYLDQTRLRLRVVTEEGQPPAYKLGQKIQPDPAQPSTVWHTTVYLDRSEYDLLRSLPGRTVEKTRTLLSWDDHIVAVDVFTGRLHGLVLAEVDLGERGALPTPPPPFASAGEVTTDNRFTGGALADTSRETLTTLLAEHHIHPDR